MLRRILFILLLFPGLVWAQQDTYEGWLNAEGYYLMTPYQKEEFRSLPETDKALYIKNLWDSLDPNPITPENEFKAEYERRVQHAKKHFGIPSDRAKIYILLGAPNAVDRHPNSDKFYPLELWSYYSLGYRGLPPSLDLIFFKRWGVGDYRLYSPIFDGFKALTPSGVDFDNQRMRAQLKAHFDPQIVDAAQRISTGATPNESETVRMTLQDPNALRRIIGGLRPNVETTVVYQGFDAQLYAYSMPQDQGVYRTSLALAVPPQYLTFEKDNDIYNGRFDITGRITDEAGNEVVKVNDSPAVRLTSTDFEKVKSFHFSYLFNAYLLPGKYTFDCLFRDYASNAAGKIEKAFEVKPSTGEMELLPPLLAFKATSAASEHLPFKFGSLQFYPKENSSFSNDQIAYVVTSLINPKRQRLEGIWKLSMTLAKDGQNVVENHEDYAVTPTNGNVIIDRKVRLSSIIPGNYNLIVKMAQGNVTLVAETPLKISPSREVLGRLRVTPESAFSPESYHTNLALQFLNRKELDSASKHLRIALDFAPSSQAARALQARLEKEKGNVDVAIATYQKLLAETPGDSEGFYLVGKWLMEKKNWTKSSEMLKKSLALGYYTTELLNDLARVQLQLGSKADAITYWEKSLALNADQPDVKKELSSHRQ